MSHLSILDLGQSQSDSSFDVPISNSSFSFPSSTTYCDDLIHLSQSSEIKSSSSSETQPVEVPVAIVHSSLLRAKRSEPFPMTGNLDSSDQCSKRSRSFNPDAPVLPAQNMTTWPQLVQLYSSRLEIISSAPIEQQPQPSTLVSQLPSFSSLTSALSSRSLPILPARRPPIPLLSSSVTQTTLFRLINRSTGKSVPSYSLLNHNTSALNVLELCSGDIFSFFDGNNMLIIPQRVLLAGRVLEGENGVYRFPCLKISDQICLRATYEAAELLFRCVSVQRPFVDPITKESSMKEEDLELNDSGSNKTSSTLFCPLHKYSTISSFNSNKTRLISLLKTLSPEVFQHRMEVIRREDPNRWKFFSSAEKSVILQIARVDELLYLLPSQCICLSEKQRQSARVKMNSKAQEPMESAYKVRTDAD